jgi:hypothetical protein
MSRVLLSVVIAVCAAFAATAVAWLAGFLISDVLGVHVDLEVATVWIFAAFWVGFIAGGVWWWRRSR